MAKVSRDIPLNELILRKYERPSEQIEKRELVKKLCLSIGLLQPGDSRDVVVDILHVILDHKELDVDTIVEKVTEYRKDSKLPLVGIAPSNVRRQLRRLKEMYIIEKWDNKYRVSENESLDRIFQEKIEKYLLPSILNRIKEYLALLK